MSTAEEPLAVRAHPAAAVNAISLKLPPFWPADPDMWFAQVEAQFSTKGIRVEKTKFDYIVASLSPDAATEVRDLILSPPADNPYTALKTALIRRTAGSNQQKLQRLLNELELGDRKPSQLLRRMRQLWCGGDTDNALLRELFLQRLPSSVRMVLAPSGTDISLNNLADMADRIMEVSTPTVAAVHAPPPEPVPTELGSLRAEVRQLREMMQSLSFPSRNARHRSPTPARRRSPSPSRQQPPEEPTLCWYHQQFGNAATKCRQPCRQGLNDQARR